jgi:hypothetical protein
VIKIDLFVGVLMFALWVFCLVDVIGSRDYQVRNLSKTTWLLVVLFFPLVGSIAWLAAGRPDSSAPARSRWERPAPAFPEYDRPGRAASEDPEKDEEFLRQQLVRAEEQRRRYKKTSPLEPDADQQVEPDADRPAEPDDTDRPVD